MMSLGQYFPDAGEQWHAADELKRACAAAARLADTFGIDPATGETLRSADRSRLAAHVTAYRLKVGYPVGNGGDTGYVHGPELPSIDIPESSRLPMSYRGPMLQGDGESRCYWGRTA